MCDAVHDCILILFHPATAKALLQALFAKICCSHIGNVGITGVFVLTTRPLLYAITSTISLFSLQLAEMIGLVRDLYEVCRTAHPGLCDLLFFRPSRRVSIR